MAGISKERIDAVWAAVYVRVLSATPPTAPAADHDIVGVAEALSDPTKERMRIAIKAANEAADLLAGLRIVMANDIDWIVNDLGEMGVKIGDRFAFCYKGRTIEYGPMHEDGKTPMKWRHVGKREFGETVRPVAETLGEVVVDGDGLYRRGATGTRCRGVTP